MNMTHTDNNKLRFEVPYNLKTETIDLLNYFSVQPDFISYIYMVPFTQDYLASYRNDLYQLEIESISREEYERQIQYIHQHGFGQRLMLLLQRPNIFLNQDQLMYYIKLGFNGFCVGSIEQAKRIKEIYPNFYVLGSILMKVDLDIINQNFENFKQYFDGFVLPFKFNRHFDMIKELPKDFKYTLLVNCAWSNICPCTPHWLYGDSSKCYKKIKYPNMYVPWKETSLIQPQDLTLFQPYIYSFKLQGRDYTTPQLIQELLIYMSTMHYIEINHTINNIELYNETI